MQDLACDILLFVATATEYEELEAAARSMGLEWRSVRSDLGRCRRLGVLGGARVVAVRTEIGGVGPRGTTRAANFYLRLTGARCLVSVGMAFGVARHAQSLGTVLVADAIVPYDRRQVVADGERWSYRYDERFAPYPADRKLLDVFRRHQTGVALPHAVEFGGLLSGAARIDCACFRDMLVERTGAVARVIGGEMEGVGFLSIESAARWIVVKGVSDFADEARARDVETHRRIACRNAAGFTLSALARWAPEEVVL